jgi:hypothetical protein
MFFPGETGVLADTYAQDAFLDALNDPELYVILLERDAVKCEQAYSICTRLEASSRIVEYGDR